LNFINESNLTRWARAAARLWIFLDYDGTLASFAATPDDLEPDPRVIWLLQSLGRSPRRRLAILSGRKLAAMRALVPVSGLFLGGAYGLEWQTSSGDIRRRADLAAIAPVVAEVRSRWRPLVAGQAGFFLEDKGWTVALHARLAAERDAERVLALARRSAAEAIQPAAGAFRLMEGRRFLEAAPTVADKGQSVTFLLREFPWLGAQLLYIGDDDRDQAAFRAVHGRGGAAIWVQGDGLRPMPPEADYALASPADVRRWLAKLIP